MLYIFFLPYRQHRDFLTKKDTIAFDIEQAKRLLHSGRCIGRTQSTRKASQCRPGARYLSLFRGILKIHGFEPLFVPPIGQFLTLPVRSTRSIYENFWVAQAVDQPEFPFLLTLPLAA